MKKEKIEIYILAINEFDEEYDKEIYIPLMCGSSINPNKTNYIQDNIGDNISKFNKYYSELTGEYWAWKHSKADILGFCHYRRFYAKDLRFTKITKEDIINDLSEYDIILPQATHLNITNRQDIYYGLKEHPNYGARCEDYMKLNNLLKNEFPDYYPAFKKVLNKKSIYNNNMFISDRNLANTYFEWAFQVFEKLMPKIDFESYPANEKRVFGFMGEFLLTTFVEKNGLKAKEYYVYNTQRKFPIITVLNRKFPRISKLERMITPKSKRR